LSANISENDEDSDKMWTALTRTIFSALDKTFCKHRFTTNKVRPISAHVDLPQVDNASSAYANAFEFGPRDFDAGEISLPT